MRKRFTKVFVLIVALTMACILAACANSQSKNTSESAAIQETSSVATLDVGDTSQYESKTDVNAGEKEQISGATTTSNTTTANSAHAQESTSVNSKNANGSGGSTNKSNNTGKSKPAAQTTAQKTTAHVHQWSKTTAHHDAIGHYDTRVAGTEEVIVGYRDGEIERYRCVACKTVCYTYDEWEKHSRDTGHSESLVDYKQIPITETREIFETVWVIDMPAWDATITMCAICGAAK